MILGVDPGERHVGLATADESIRIATPLEVVDARAVDPVERIVEVVGEVGATAVVVGKPVGLSGRAGPAVDRQSAFLAKLRGRLEVPVQEFDERLTSVIAERGLRASGARRAARRRMTDAVAAQVLLQDYLDASR